jgi:RHS repeat-associated protein
MLPFFYLPFGETRSGSLPTDKLFTGQRLAGTGLYYYNARYYDATIGRFISPDTVIPNPANPQCFNRYSYVLNNPLKYTDPSGLSGIGHTTREDETYIIDEQNGKYRMIETDQTVTAWYSSMAELQAAWNEYIKQRGGSNSWVVWVPGRTYEIPVSDKTLYDKPIIITLVPEGSGWAGFINRRGATGTSFIGEYVRYEWYEQYSTTEALVRAIRHEWFHEYEKKTQFNWFFNYINTYKELLKDYTDAYNVHPAEVRARVYAGEDPYPYGEPKKRNLVLRMFLNLLF